MSASRPLTRIVPRVISAAAWKPRSLVTKTHAFHTRVVPRRGGSILPHAISARSVRYISNDSPPSKLYSFDEIKDLVANQDPDQTLIDVREPAEYEAGFIPTAINIPIKSQPDAIFLEPEEFEERFGFAKPPVENELVFYCKAGVRSRAAAQLARQGGYGRVGEYAGSWDDWVGRGGDSGKEGSSKV